MTQRISGTMLKDNLIRNGTNLSIESDLLYVDVQNNRIGVNTNMPAVALEVNGSFIAGDMQITNGELTVSTVSGLSIECGTNNISVNDSKIVLCADPVNPQDVVNLRTLEDLVGGIATNIIVDGPTYALAVDDSYGGYIEIAPDGIVTARFDTNQALFQTNVNVNGTMHSEYLISDEGARINSITIVDSTIASETGSGLDLNLSADSGYINLQSDVILSTQIPGSVLYVDGAGNLTTSANFTYDNTTLTISDDVSITNSLTVTNTSYLDELTVANNEISIDTNSLELTAGSSNDINLNVEFDGVIRANATSAFKLPVGVTGERPSIPEAGMIRFNSSLGEAEMFDGVSWSGVSADFVDLHVDLFAGDGSTTVFTLTTGDPTSENSLFIDINGVMQIPGTAYLYNSSLKEITFLEAPAPGDFITVRLIASVTDIRAISDLSGTAEVIAESGEVAIKMSGVDHLRFNGTDAVITTTLRPAVSNGQNLGSAAYKFNNLHVTLINGAAADIAERFAAEDEYEPGTVVVLAESGKVVPCSEHFDALVVGIVSTEPAYILNAYEEGAVPIAMTGTVPCKVVGPVNKGDLLATSAHLGHARSVKNGDYVPGTVIAKALEGFGQGTGVIKVLVWAA